MITLDTVELSRSAWNAARTDSQPVYDELVDSYKEMLHARAQNVATLGYPTSEGGIFQTFEQNVVEALQPERFHPLSKAFRPDLFPEPEVVKEELVAEVKQEKKATPPPKVAQPQAKVAPKPVKAVKKGGKK